MTNELLLLANIPSGTLAVIIVFHLAWEPFSYIGTTSISNLLSPMSILDDDIVVFPCSRGITHLTCLETSGVDPFVGLSGVGHDEAIFPLSSIDVAAIQLQDTTDMAS